MAEKSPEPPVLQQMYALVRWSCERVAKFPRSFRCTLGDRLEHRLYDILDGLNRARYARERLEILHCVNADLELLRVQFRLAHDLKCISTSAYGHAARELQEIGSQVGGWIKAQGQPAQPARPASRDLFGPTKPGGKQ